MRKLRGKTLIAEHISADEARIEKLHQFVLRGAEVEGLTLHADGPGWEGINQGATMHQISVRAACLLVVATAWLTSPAFGADLPKNTPGNSQEVLFIRNEANTRLLEVDPTAVNPAANPSGVAVQLQPPSFSRSHWWQLLPSGRPGQVVISHFNTRLILDAEPPPNDTDPAKVKLALPTAAPATSQQWRIIESGKGTFFIKNVQTGQLLDADTGTLTTAFTNVQLLGRDDSTQNHGQWRFFPSQPQQTNGGNLQMLSPRVQEPQPPPAGAISFHGKKPKMTVTVTITGHNQDQLTAAVSLTIESTTSGEVVGLPSAFFPIVLDNKTGKTNAPGRKIILTRVPRGLPLSQTLTYTDTDDKPDFVVPGLGKVATVPLVGNPNDIVRFCLCVGDPGPPGASLTPTGVFVFLEPLDFVVDVPNVP